MEREIAVANGGDAAERIDGQKLWSLKLALGRFEKLPVIGDTPGRRTAWTVTQALEGSFRMVWQTAKICSRSQR